MYDDALDYPRMTREDEYFEMLEAYLRCSADHPEDPVPRYGSGTGTTGCLPELQQGQQHAGG